MTYNVLQYLEKSADKYPQKIALEDDREKVSYEEYMNCARKIGTYITYAVEGRTNEPVAVLIDRNIWSLITFMGVVYSGNFYVPIDASMPEKRVQLICENLQPIMVIDARYRADDRIDVKYQDIVDNTEIDFEKLMKIRDNAIDTDPLYSIFTSGSTGVPKGVLISHRSVLDLVEAFEEAFAFGENTVFGNQAPFDFDVSVKDTYNALRCGGTIQVLPKKLFKMPKLLVGYLCERKVNTLIWAVSALRIVADFKTMDEGEIPALDNVMFSGELMPVRALNYWMEKIPKARFVNLYGPTEITCNCTYYEVKYKHKEDELLPIGKAFRNSRVVLRDENNHFITEKDKVGEICVMGTCLALGYWNNWERTQSAFVQNPVNEAYESRMYATGDMGYYNSDGDIVFASRRDYQIKHMGHRIELGEIEVALNAISFLTVSCCLYDEVNERIVCFYQATQECKKEIVTELSKKLPKYMWPNVYVYYEELPLNKNGKIDRVALANTLK